MLKKMIYPTRKALLSKIFFPILFAQCVLFNYGLEAKVNCKKILEAKKEIIEKLGAFLPSSIEGWKASEEDNLYDPETIFSYIDGAGEVYRSYNFRWLLVRRYEKENFPPIIVDFFDMGRSENAFGVFTHDLEGDRVPIGQDGLYKGGWLAFWKGRFYVSIYSEAETETTKKIILALGEKIAKAIPEEGQRPHILDYLPSNWEKSQARYFRTLPILNYHFFVSTENWLELDETTQALLAHRLAENKRKTYLLLIEYPDEARAQRAIKKFLDNYLPEAKESGTARTENGLWEGARVYQNIGLLVFAASSSEEIEEIFKDVLIKIKEKKNQRS